MLLLSFSLGSHAGAAPGWVWAVLGDYLHLLAAAAWIGGLVLLPLLIWRVLRASSPLSPVLFWPAVQRFSRLAALAVFILSTTGFFNSLVQLPSLSSLLETTYGWVLLLKLGLTALVLILALLNHRLVHSRAHPLQTAEAWPRFQRQVMLESMLGLGLMVSVAVLVQTPTPASFGGNNPPSGQLFEQITQADDLTIHTQVLPNQVGQNLFLVHLYHQDNSPVGEVQLVRLFFNYQETQLGQAQANMALWQDNFFRLEGAFLNQAGQWNLSIYVRRRGMDDILTDVTLEVPPAAGQITNASPWQNPIPGWPVEVVIAGVVGAMGGSVFLWGWLRRR
jgi:copper transport protein